MFLCVSLDSMEYKGCRDNHVSLILKHHMIMCSYTLPYFAHFLYLTHTHTYFVMFECLLPCLYHFIDTICSLMSICFLNYALNSVWCLIQNSDLGLTWC